MKKLFNILIRALLVLVLIPIAGILGIFLNYHLIALSVSDRVYEKVTDVTYRKYTLVMGGGNYKPEMWTNHTFNHRMLTTAQLFSENKTEKVIASGVRVSNDLDEVTEMKQVLLQYGISENAIISDYGGLRTWTSLERTLNYHQVDTIIIVSQLDQLERALFISRCLGIDAIGLLAEPAPRKHKLWTLREYLARVKCTIDCLAFKYNFS